MIQQPRAWLIDLDGTLVDTLGDFVAALAEVAAQLRRPPPEAALVRSLIGRGGERLIRDLLALWQRPETEFATAWAVYGEAYARVNGQHARVFEGVREGLVGLAGMPLACVTNKPQANAEALLERLALRPAFAAVIGQRPGLRAKPHPDAFLAAAEALGLPISQCGVIGDSRNDAEAGRAAGCAPIVLLRHGYNHGEPVDAVPAEAHLDRLDQLPP
ncbi:MAG: HAD-IA family hydrolase [Inhella sp.]